MIYHGLMIGIDYRNTASRLAGCIADSEAWHSLFAPVCNGGLFKLQEDKAKKRFIVEAMKAVAGVCPVGSDHFGIITFSGHGTYRQGSQDPNEVDGRDEALCPFDFQQQLLWDNEIAEILNGSQVAFISDCCHSGTLTRSITDSEIDAWPRFVAFEQICEGLAQCEINKLVEPANKFRKKARAIRAANDGAIPGIIHLAGCLDNEFSYDTPRGGALTINAIEAYHQLPDLTDWDHYIDAIKQRLPDRAGRYPQHPQLTATAQDMRRVLPGKELPLPVPTPVEHVLQFPEGRHVLRGTFENGRKFRFEVEP